MRIASNVPPIASVTAPNRLPAEALLRRPGADGQVSIDPPVADWRFLCSASS